MLPINSQSDYTNLTKDAKFVCKRFKPVKQTINTNNSKILFSNEISVEGLLQDICFFAKIRMIDDAGVQYLPTGDELTEVSLSENLKTIVE
jgi:hypothetical protein